MVAIADRRNKIQRDKESALVLWFKNICMSNISWGGRKNAFLREAKRFSVTGYADRYFIEGAKNRLTDKLDVVPTHPKTVRSQKFVNILQTYKLNSAVDKILAVGRSVGEKDERGKFCLESIPSICRST